MGKVPDKVAEVLTASNKNAESLAQEIVRLQQQLDEEMELRRVDSVHAADQLHRLEARVLKTLKAEIPRMEELLAANQSQPPKTHIIDAYGRDTLKAITDLFESVGGKR